ncbi:MAG TPA: cation diffusion facilitator family transporter [Myxococcota bacterium]|nr:cation diffusion facilitator family transporter [Myxococcota bacterium]
MHEGSRRAIIAAFAANLAIAIAKFVAFFFTGAASLLAEGVHSVADTGNQALLFLGSALGRRAPTEEHPFGFGRERYFWAFVVALVLFSVGSLFAIREGVVKIRSPHAIESPLWALAVLGVSIVLETFSFVTAQREANKVRRGESWLAFIRHTKNPELPVVLLEDLGALIGLGFALVGVGLALWTGDSRFDAAGSIAIGALLGGIAIVLSVEMKSLLIGEAASPADVKKIRAAMESAPNVARVIHLRTMHLGPDDLLVASKIAFDPKLDFASLAQAIDETERRVRAVTPAARLIFLEPDVDRGPAGPTV